MFWNSAFWEMAFNYTHLFNMDKKYMYCGTYINIILFIIN